MADTSMTRLPGIIFPSDRGPRTSATLLQVFIELGNNPATVVLDQGDWLITDYVAVPDQVTLILLRGAVFRLQNGEVDFQYCGLQAPPNLIFQNDFGGAINGTPSFPFRHPEWGDVNLYAIGEGYLEKDYDISGYLANKDDVNAGTSDALAITPLALRQSQLEPSQLPSHDNLRGIAPDQHRRIHVSAGVPTGGQDGDIWVQYS